MVNDAVVKKLNAVQMKAVIAAENNLDMDVVVHDSVESTNTWALHQSKAGRKIPFACFAELQTQGRGRRGKFWLMQPHANVAMSLTWPLDLSSPQVNLLPLSVALAIVETLESIGIGDVMIKWPNDVYVKGKKISGVLIETQSAEMALVDKCDDKDEENKNWVAAVIGIGLNFDMSPEMPAEKNTVPVLTDICSELLALENTKEISRQFIAVSLLQKVTTVCQNFQWDADRYLGKLRERYDYCKGREVEVILADDEILLGRALGVNDSAELVVLINGEERVFNSAEVSVRAGV